MTTTYTIDFNPILQMSDEQFDLLCRTNPDLKFERNSQGRILIMSPTGGVTGNRNSEIIAEFVNWNRRQQLGVVFDSSTGFKLPNRANRSPDVAWVSKERWDALTPEQQEKFPPIAPDFVLKLMSPTDNLSEVQAKMCEYIENGVRLGWLIERQHRYVEIYHPDRSVQMMENPTRLSGEDVLPGFELDCPIVW